MASYADVTAKNAHQSPEEAAAPLPPTIETDTSISTSSLVDVDAPKVTSVPSTFPSQDIQTSTQADRRKREERALEEKARAEADLARKKARQADSWVVKKIRALGEGESTALVAANVAAVLGLAGVLGYKAWGLQKTGRLDWKVLGICAGVLATVGAVEGVFARYFYKARGKKQ